MLQNEDGSSPEATIPHTVSLPGLKFIGAHEGLELHPYNDSGNNATIGYGHLIHMGPVNAADNFKYRNFNRAAALAYLDTDVSLAVIVIRHVVTVPLTQPQFDALVSFVYNIGADAFKNSMLLQHLNKRQYQLVPADLLEWDHVNGVVIQGLLNRRRDEGELFAHGVY